MDVRIEGPDSLGRDSERITRRPTPLAQASAQILERALAYLTSDLDRDAAVCMRAEARLSPDSAARCGYALGYLEGGTDQAAATLDTPSLPDDLAGALRDRLAALLAEPPRQ